MKTLTILPGQLYVDETVSKPDEFSCPSFAPVFVLLL